MKIFFLIKTEESKNQSILLAVLCEKKANYLSDAGADPRIMKSSALLKLEHGNKER